MEATAPQETKDGLVNLRRDASNGYIGPLLLRQISLLDQQQPGSKRSSVAFIDVLPQKCEIVDDVDSRTVTTATEEGESAKWRKRISLDSVKSLLSTSSSVLPTGYTGYHIIVFILTYCSYMMFHAMRKTFSTVKADMVTAWMGQNVSDSSLNGSRTTHQLFSDESAAQDFLGALDAIFMFCYAAGLYVCGILGDRFDPRLVLVIGMCGTAIINMLFGCVTAWTEYYSIPLYVVLWVLNGFMQAAGWPTVVCVMGNWFGRGGRGFILGFWSSCQSIGNIVGTYLCMAVLNYGYEYAFLINASLLFVLGIVVFFTLVPAPRDMGLPDPDDKSGQERRASGNTEVGSVISERPKPITFWKAFLLPGVIVYSLAYACIKLVNYSVLFWLPYYFDKNFGWSPTDAASVSSYYDWGGVIGGTIGGVVSDLLGKRAPVVSSQLAFSVIAFGFYTLSPNDQLINGILMGIVGFFVGGAANLISAAVSADLGRQDAVRNSAEALSTVSGIVDGSGSIGAAIGQILVPLFQHWFNWMSIFYMFMATLFLSLVLLARLCYRESRDICDRFKQKINLLSAGAGQPSSDNGIQLSGVVIVDDTKVV